MCYSVRKMVMVLEAGVADSFLSWLIVRLLESTRKNLLLPSTYLDVK